MAAQNWTAESSADLQRVEEAICDAKSLSIEARNMMIASLPHAFERIEGGFHPMQTGMIEHIRACITESEQEKANQVTKLQQETTDTREIAQELEKAAKEAVASEEAARAHVEVAKGKVDDMTKEVSQHERYHKDMKSAEKSDNERARALEEKLNTVAAKLDGPHKMLAEGGALDAEMNATCVHEIEQMLQELDAEKALIVSMPLAYQRKPEERHEFDNLIVQSVFNVLQAHQNQLKEQLDAIRSQCENSRCEQWGAFAILEVGRDRLREAQTELSTAKTQLSSRVSERKRKEDDEAQQKRAVVESDVAVAAEIARKEVAANALHALERLLAEPVAEAETKMDVAQVEPEANVETEAKMDVEPDAGMDVEKTEVCVPAEADVDMGDSNVKHLDAPLEQAPIASEVLGA